MAQEKTVITVESTINAPIAKVWDYWTDPTHIVKWNSASDDWHTTKSENDPRTGGKFSARMEAKDGSFGFDFAGVYDEVRDQEYIEYSLGDDRKVTIEFTVKDGQTTVVEKFDAENTHPVEVQRGGWQAILDNFKKYTESN